MYKRQSLQWARIISDRDGTVNRKGIGFYHRVIDALLDNGIEPILCLNHFDMPMYWMEKGGFECRETVDAFAAFARVCYGEFSGKVRRWVTFNEPVITPEQGLSLIHI